MQRKETKPPIGGREWHETRDRKVIVNALAGMSPGNRKDVEAFLAAKKRRVGTSQIRKYATLLAQVDRHTNGTPWRKLTPDQAGAWLDDRLTRVDRRTAGTDVVFLRAVLKWCDDPDEGRLPKGFRSALDLGPMRERPARRIVPDPDLFQVLEAASADAGFKALLWLLRSAGLRIGEALSLDVGHLQLHADEYDLSMPPKDKARYRLKYGPRDIVGLIEGLGALREWLQAHPRGSDPDAPLFLTAARGRGTGFTDRPPDYLTAKKRLDRVTSTAEVTPFTFHCLRHTRAYWAKMNDWSDSKMLTFIGWGLGSRMPRYYGGLVAKDLRETLRRDAGVNNLGQVVLHKTESDATLAQLADLLGKIQNQATRNTKS